MTQLFKRILVAASALAATCGSSWASDLDPVVTRKWPMDIQINLTSSFGEYRSGHLHAGLDIKTYGKEGIPCQAVGDGYVSRMRAAPNGYGKALYLKLDTGETAVYAHLAEFAPRLESALYEEQRQAGRYRIDSYFGADRFRVSEGEVIGYSGRTGTSAPHLHFEIRDEDENPLNPLSRGWKLADNTPPEFHGAIFVPLAEHSSVDGAFEPRGVSLRAVGVDRYVASDTAVVSGRVGVGAYIIDRLNSVSGRLAPYRVELTVDGVLLSSITFESFTYRHTAEVDLAYDIERVRKDRQNYLLLFRRTGETLWNRTFVHDGVIDTEVLPAMVGERRRVYTAVIRTIDRAGNVSTALLPFTTGDRTPSAPREVMEGSAGFYLFEDLCGIKPGSLDAFRASIDSNADAGERYVVTVHELLGDDRALRRPIDFAGERGTKTYLIPVRRGETVATRFDELGIELISNDNSLYSDAFIYVAKWHAEQGVGLKSVMEPFRIGPASLALRKPIEIRYGGDKMDDRGAFYVLDEREQEWQFAGGEVAGDTVVTTVREPGVYGVFVDNEAPTVLGGVLRTYNSYATGDPVREIVIRIEDSGSGVDDDRTEIYVDGNRQIARWDGFSDRMFVRLWDDAVSGEVDVSIVAFDRAGNETRTDSRVDTGEAQN